MLLTIFSQKQGVLGDMKNDLTKCVWIAGSSVMKRPTCVFDMEEREFEKDPGISVVHLATSGS